MKRKTIILIIMVGIVLLAGGFFFFLFFTGEMGEQVLAKVNGEKITLDQFNKEIARVEEPYRGILSEDPGKLLDSMIVKTLILQEAKKQGPTPPIKSYKDNTKDSLSSEVSLIAELMKKKFPSPPEVKREEVEAFYSTFKDQMEGKPLSQMAPMIEQFIRETKQQEEMGRFIEDLRKTAKIEIHQDRLKKIMAKPPESNTEEDFKKAITDGKPVLVDFGSNSCIPCRQMRPILKEVGKEYAGKASVLVIDVYKYQRLARDYKVQLIPTLIFFDSKGKEVFRHAGAMEKEKIVEKLKEVGVSS